MADSASLAFINDFAEFIEASPTSYHAVAKMAELLTEAGFTRFDERDSWGHEFADCPNGFLIRDGAIIAWQLPKSVACPTSDTGQLAFKIVGAHTDSPSLKLKPNPDFTTAGWCQAGVEVYGGPQIATWFDRELGFAGRLTTTDGQVKLVRTGAIMRISQLAPHLVKGDRAEYHFDKQAHLQPVYGVGCSQADILDQLCKLARIERNQLAYYDIYAYPVEKPAVFGLEQEFFAAKRMDNLSSVYPGLRAMLAGVASDEQLGLESIISSESGGQTVKVLACFDHEEVGSQTSSGADSPFLADVLARIAEGLGVVGADYRAMLARSSCISADAGHLANPNYLSHYDPNNRPLLNAGPLLKINANQRYATDAIGGQIFIKACANAGVDFQYFVSNNEIPCGTTIGPITASKLGIKTVDVGIGLASMHSTREMCGVADPLALAKALAAYLHN